jgi:hypothetical protein
MSLRSGPDFRPPEGLRSVLLYDVKKCQDNASASLCRYRHEVPILSPMHADRDKVGWYVEEWPISEGLGFGQALAIMSFPERVAVALIATMYGSVEVTFGKTLRERDLPQEVTDA